MSKQTTFTLTFLAGLSVIVPGCAGYLSARMDAVERAHRELVSLESRIRQEQLIAPVAGAEGSPIWARNETVAVPGMTLCDVKPRPQAGNRRERGSGTLAGGVGAVSGAHVSVSAETSKAAEREQRRRQRQERLCAATPERPATDAPADGSVTGSSQAEAPAN
ncbi:hypothetical protein [Streptosporangium saharense]|uniref:hypothetical protein n=1 Tax=Streptosporangium saharense TaxID=1706840 RepID=UPI0033255802